MCVKCKKNEQNMNNSHCKCSTNEQLFDDVFITGNNVNKHQYMCVF